MSHQFHNWARVGLFLPALVIAAFMLFKRSETPRAPELPSPTIRLNRDHGDVFEVRGLDPVISSQISVVDLPPSACTAFFSVMANQSAEPMMGSYSVEAGVFRFRPRWPLVPGVTYAAHLNPLKQPVMPSLAAPLTATFSIPQPPLPPPAVIAGVYPSADRLPENLLRMYVYFTAPMRQGDAYDHIRLLGPDGKPIATPFVTLGEELWNADGTRLTLLLDPGRQKHDLLPRQQAGPVLEDGKTYALIIDVGWADVHGRPLGKEFRKAFQVIAPETRPIKPALWTIQPPSASTREPLTVKFDRSLDHALIKRVIAVVNADGKAIDGEVQAAEAESTWRFVPRQPWQAGDYGLLIEAILEDVAGNRIGRAFEVDEDRPDPGPSGATVRQFTIAPK